MPRVEEPVNIFDPMPHRYMFVPDRNRHLMEKCRERTHAIGRPVYVVHGERGGPIGLRVPHYVVEPVVWEMETAASESASESGTGSDDADRERDCAVREEVKVNPDLEVFLNPELGICSEEDLEIIFEIMGVRPEALARPGEFDWVVGDDDLDLEQGDEGYASGSDATEDSDWSMGSNDDESEGDESEDDELLDLDWTVGEHDDESDLSDEMREG